LQWLQDPSKINGDNLKNIRNKKREYLNNKIDELAMNGKNKNIRHLYRGINGFNRGYQSKSNLVKDDNGDCLQIPTF
jgi:hypothetical protein